MSEVMMFNFCGIVLSRLTLNFIVKYMYVRHSAVYVTAWKWKSMVVTSDLIKSKIKYVQHHVKYLPRNVHSYLWANYYQEL